MDVYNNDEDLNENGCGKCSCDRLLNPKHQPYCKYIITMAGGGGPSSGTVEPPLSQAYGYGIVVGLGFLFALGMIFTTWVLKRYNHEKQTSEMFNTAGRTVKSGLVASAVVSSWTWAATLLQSSGVAYRYGVSGPFWVSRLFVNREI